MRPFLLAFVLLSALATVLGIVGLVGVMSLHQRRPPAVAAMVGHGAAPATPNDPHDDSRGSPVREPVDPFAEALRLRSGQAQPAAAAQRGDRAIRPAPAPWPPEPAPVVIEPPRPVPIHEGPLVLPAIEATVKGREIRVELGSDGMRVVSWRDPAAQVRWPLPPIKPGWYEVEVTFACDPDGGGSFVCTVGDQRLAGKSRPTGEGPAWRTDRLGNLLLGTDMQNLIVQADGAITRELMMLRQVRLVPVR